VPSVGEGHNYRSWVEVDLDSFSKNWEELKRLVAPGVKIMQVVKADAYGHGSLEIAQKAVQNGACCLGVANADEGVQLRVGGIQEPIVILSPSPGGEIGEIIKYNLTPSVSDLAFAGELQAACRKAAIRLPIHVEVDTGMGRGGILYYEAMNSIREVAAMPNLVLQGVFTHLSSSEIRVDYNDIQWKLFRDLLDGLEAAGIRVPMRHMSNSGAILNYPAFNLDMVRPGLMTYGIYPSLETRERAALSPVMSFKTRVVLLKDFPRGYSIGYNRTYITERPTRIATIPIGYGDGYGVILSNSGEVLIRGRRAPVVGRVSMDMCTVDVSRIPECALGDEVVLMGAQGGEEITANDVADRVKTITYEILCALGKRAPRVFIQKGRADAVLPRLRRIYIPDEEKSIARIDNIIRRCLQARTRSEELGDAIYYEMFETLFGREGRQLELREDFRYHIEVEAVAPQEGRRGGHDKDNLGVTTRVEYRKILRHSRFIIACALDNEQLDALFDEPRCEYRWLMNRGEDPVMERDFRVARVAVDGLEVPVLEALCTGRGYEITCGNGELEGKLNKPVNFSIEIVTRKSRRNNIFSVYLVYPTRGLEITFDYGKAGLKNVREVSFFAGKHPKPEIERVKGKGITLKIPAENWIFPTSGVTFIWDN